MGKMILLALVALVPGNHALWAQKIKRY